ncbi:MAG: hypothetical protein WD873_05410 [Candidatus Hydrogenedentales bacterium]
MGFRWHMVALAALLGCALGCSEAPTTVLLAAAAPAPQAEQPPQPPPLKYLDLERGRYYSVSALTPVQAILPDEVGAPGRMEKLPPAGIFQVVDQHQAEATLWYRVLVSNGADRYTMYLNARDLDRQDVTPYIPPAPSAEARPVPEPPRVSTPRVRLF